MSNEDLIEELKSQSRTTIDSLVQNFPKSIADSAGLKASLLRSLESVYSKGHTPYNEIATVSELQGRTDVTSLDMECKGRLTEDPLLKGSYICALKYYSVINVGCVFLYRGLRGDTLITNRMTKN
jgi:hypothetical protein